MGKEEAKKRVIEKGGIVRDEITTDLWYLVTNDFQGNAKKYEKARKLGVTFIDETEFLEMLK
jgi:DNA ligase (NAD+)